MTLNIAIIGAGMAGITAARTLVQAGHRVHIFEKSRSAAGRMSTRETVFGTFDHGTQYFTVRDPRFAKALETVPSLCRPWSANAVRVLDSRGRVAAAGLPLKFSRSDAGHEKPAPLPGAHTAAVLERLLGLGADEVSQLRSDGIV